jgi:hypothetical protein
VTSRAGEGATTHRPPPHSSATSSRQRARRWPTPESRASRHAGAFAPRHAHSRKSSVAGCVDLAMHRTGFSFAGRRAPTRHSVGSSGLGLRWKRLEDQLSDPTRSLVHREVPGTRNRGERHARALLEHAPLLVCEPGVVPFAEDNMRLHAGRRARPRAARSCPSTGRRAARSRRSPAASWRRDGSSQRASAARPSSPRRTPPCRALPAAGAQSERRRTARIRATPSRCVRSIAAPSPSPSVTQVHSRPPTSSSPPTRRGDEWAAISVNNLPPG